MLLKSVYVAALTYVLGGVIAFFVAGLIKLMSVALNRRVEAADAEHISKEEL